MKKYKNPIIALLAVCCLLLNTLPVSAAQDGSYRLDVKDGVVRFIRDGKMAKYAAVEPVELTVRTDKDGELIVVLRTEDGYQNVTLGNQGSLEITGDIGKLFLSASLDPGISVSVGEKSNIQEMYIRNDGEVTIAGETGTVEVTGAATVTFVGTSYVEQLTVTNSRASVSVKNGAVIGETFTASGAKVSGVSSVRPLPEEPETDISDDIERDRSPESTILDKIGEQEPSPSPSNPVTPVPNNEIISVSTTGNWQTVVVLVRFKKEIRNASFLTALITSADANDKYLSHSCAIVDDFEISIEFNGKLSSNKLYTLEITFDGEEPYRKEFRA